MLNRDKEILIYIIDHCDVIENAINSVKLDDFLNSRILSDAVAFNIFQIGELAKKLSESIITEYNNVPWKDIKGMRDKICHGYETINLERVYYTAKNDISYLKEYCKKIINN